MQLGEALETAGTGVVPADFGRFREHIPLEWVQEALLATGTATVRRRRLPAEQVVWLVIGMSLIRNDSIERVVTTLDLALPSKSNATAAKSALAQARQRLGEEPMACLFATTAERWVDERASKDRWRGLALYAVDGTTLRVPDTPENWAAFGGQNGNGFRAGSSYPQVRVVALMAVRSHMISSFRFGPYNTSERALAENFWDDVPDDSLTILDRNYLAVRDLTQLRLSGKNKHWLTRAKSTTRIRSLERLGKNDELVEIELSDKTKRDNGAPETWVARAIKYKKKGHKTSTLLTSLVDAAAYPASELVAMYHERWEIEIGYDEVKTHLLDRQEAIRSRTPSGVRQEMWGLALAYNLVRLEMARAAEVFEVPPNRISFVNAVALIRGTFWMAGSLPLAPGTIPPRLHDLRRYMKLLVLPPRRPERVYRREVKIKMSTYPKKAPRGRGRK